jgi:hypothetical protein
MQEIRGIQQSDNWLRARCGRITGSKLADVCDVVVKGSAARGDKAVLPGAKRKLYWRACLGERLTGQLANHWASEYMARGEREEEPARMFYEAITRTMVVPVSFVVHTEFPWTGASADGLVGKEGVLEIKNPSTEKHLLYWEQGLVPEDYIPQCAWEMACAGPERKFVDFLSFDRRIQDANLCYFLKRTGRDELEWSIPYIDEAGKAQTRALTGEAVIDYFTSEAVKMNAEIEAFLAEHNAKPIAPFPLEFREEEAPDPGYDASKGFDQQDYSFLDAGVDAP